MKNRNTNLGDWITVITLLDEKKLKQSLIGKKVEEKESTDLKKGLQPPF